jgi:predicted secreted Zn-dependent protease
VPGLEARRLLAAPIAPPTAEVAGHVSASARGKKVTIYPTTNYTYAIQGTTRDALLAEIEREGPQDDLIGQRRFTTIIRWFIQARFESVVVGGTCRIGRVFVEEDSYTIFPNWVNRSQAPRALQQRWNRYVGALRQHARTHLAFGKDAASEIAQKALDLKPAASCEQLEAQFNQMVDRVIAKHRRKGFAFDRRTNHGETLGAVL